MHALRYAFACDTVTVVKYTLTEHMTPSAPKSLFAVKFDRGSVHYKQHSVKRDPVDELFTAVPFLLGVVNVLNFFADCHVLRVAVDEKARHREVVQRLMGARDGPCR